MNIAETTKNIAEKLNSTSNRKLTWAADIAFSIFAFLFLGGYHYEYLYKLQNSSLFLTNSVFFNDILQFSAGILIYIGRFFNQFLFFPWLGGLLMALGLLLIIRTTRSIRNSEKVSFTDYLPSAALLLAQTTIGYAVYCNFDCSFAVTLEIGLIISLLIAKLLIIVRENQGHTASSLLATATIISSYAFGIMAPLALFIYGINRIGKNKRKSAITITATFISYLLITYHISKYWLNEPYMRSLLAPLPDSYFTETFLYAVGALIIAIIAVTPALIKKAEGMRPTYTLSILCLSLITVMLLTNRNENYRTEIKIQRLTDEQRWEDVIKEANQLEHPTVVSAMYRFIALHQTGRAWTEIFDYPSRFDTIKCKYNHLTRMIYGDDVFFYGSAPNEGYRSAMEEWSGKERNFDKLKFFATYALFRDETELAKHYLGRLKQSLFHKQWASDHEKYVGNRDLFLKENKTMQRIDDYEVKENHNSYGSNLQLLYAKHVKLTKEQWQYRLLLDIFFKNKDQFAFDIAGINYAFGKNIPNYLQEAIIIQAMQSQNKNLIVEHPINRDLLVWCTDYFRKASPYRKDKDKLAKEFANCKGTYSHYFTTENLFLYQKLER